MIGYSKISAGSGDAALVAAGTKNLKFAVCFNTNAAVAYLKLYNTASAPTAGAGTPIQRYAIPGATTGAGFVIPIPDDGIEFKAGIGLTIVTGAADNSSSGVTAAEVLVNLGYDVG